MKKLFVPVLAVLAAAVWVAPASALPHSSAQGLSHRDSCGIVGEGSARCFAKVVTQNGATFNGRPNSTAGVAGYHSSDLQGAYALQGVAPAGTPTVAIVDAYDDPNAETDLAAYRSQMGLTPCAATDGCFKKVNQNGGATPPAADKGWAEEISLDLDMVSSACPACHILLVEASSSSFANLGAAVDRAASMGAVAISNSYGGSEFSSETTTTYDGHFNHPGIAITVSSGDSGYGPEFPAASRYVTATGGTSLKYDPSTGVRSETAWSGAGSGCSSYETKPQWQLNGGTPSGCARRTIADVASVSDPNTGVAVNDTYGGDPGWMVFGGTSAAAPFIAAVYALNAPFTTGSYPAALPYGHTSSLFDVTSGSNGRCTSRKNTSLAYLCTATGGYDGPTGWGTPNGKAAF